MNRLLLRRMFEPDYRITTAQSGIEALTLLQQHAFDIVLLDIMMPDMSGLEVLQNIRESYAHTDLPVILVSALHESEDIVRGFKIGANDYLAKPLNVEVARARVAMQLTLKQLSDEKKQTIGELKSLQTMREMFFRTVSHDLKGPISNIRMAQYILTDMFSHDPDVRLILENVDLSLNGMQEMIQLFLDAAMLQSGSLELNVNSVRISDVIKRAVEQYQLSARGRNIQLHVFPTEHCAMADQRLLAQIIGNLVGNALKFSPHNSTIMIWAEGDPHWVRINVADQGPGIPYEERKNLFQMFGKLSVRPVGAESSTGLGLWIVKTLVEMQGGKVGVDCPPDGGSIFWFELPGCVPLSLDASPTIES
ncbi:MAG: hybrid sensor histidine kinase/response regulator [Anaerolineae bacterium]|nr:hybrid sensor histidine kinase/response regulator [Anaerolineae bacterium]